MALITIEEVSKHLGVKKPTIYEWARFGKIPCFKLNGALRFDMDEIKVWVEESRYKPTNVEIQAPKSMNHRDINSIINKTIYEHKPKGYNPTYGKPGQIRGLKKETNNGTI